MSVTFSKKLEKIYIQTKLDFIYLIRDGNQTQFSISSKMGSHMAIQSEQCR